MSEKCAHGYFTREPCPWCRDCDPGNVVPVIGHGNGWLLRQGDLVCPSCGGPGKAGWGLYIHGKAPATSLTCYGCRIGENTIEAITRRNAHVAQRGVKKQRGSK